MNIIIHPYSSCLPNGKENAKNYPYWEELVTLLQSDGHDILQIGVSGERQLVKDFRPNLNPEQHKEMLAYADTFICVDSWYPHFVRCFRPELKGIVLWGVSNPQIFGYPQNFNLYVDKKYFRPLQFDMWHNVEYNAKAFVSAGFVMEKLRAWIQSVTPKPIPEKEFDEKTGLTWHNVADVNGKIHQLLGAEGLWE